MKKIIVFVFTLLAISGKLFSQKNTTAPEIDEFLASSEFNRVINDQQWSRLGTVNRSLCYANTISEDQRAVTVNIVIENGRDHKVTAVIEAVKAPDGKHLLPNNERYAMALRNYKDFDFVNASGIIEYYDLNYKNHHGGTITVSKSVVVSWVTYDIPSEILNQDSEVIKKVHYCDKNQNGNVTWTECYQCMKKSCESNAGCDSLCDLINLIHSYCTGTIAASCVFISMWW
jgi:hypothetical protein